MRTNMKSPYDPEPIQVVTPGPDRKPVSVLVKKRRLSVSRVLNIWRIDEEWWRKPISRLYFLLELQNGMRLTVFHDLEQGGWYRQNWAE
jgi:hypothetical protein